MEFLAAPVSGNAKVIKAGELTMAVSGPEETYRRVAHLLADIAKSVTYVGDGEVSRLVKIAHNTMLGVVTQALAEITVLAEKGGVPRHSFLEFLNNSVMGSVFTRYKSPAFVNLDFTPTFTPVLLRKDFDLALEAARKLEVPMPVAAITASMVQASVGSGRVDEDFAILLGCRPPRPGWNSNPRTSSSTTAFPARSRARTMTTSALNSAPHVMSGAPIPAPGHMGSTTNSGSTSTGCAATGWTARRRPWRPASAEPSCCSISTTSATPLRPGSVVRWATR